MSTTAIHAAYAQRDALLQHVHRQWDAGMRAGIAAAAEHTPAALDTPADDPYWAAGFSAGYDAAQEG